MSILWRTALRGGLCALASAFLVSTGLGAKPGELRREAQQLVTEALFHESLGLNAERDRLLQEAEHKAPQTPGLKWAQGLVKYYDRWVPADDIPELMQRSAALRRYEQRRNDYPDTAAGQFALARYCDRQGLDDQARAHLVRVLEHEPNHSDVRRALGFVPVGGKWVHKDDVALAASALVQRQENFNRWQKRVLDLRQGLTARPRAHRETAAKRLAQIDDVAAVPALEVLLGYGPPEIASPAIAAIGAISAPEASLALARLSVHAPAAEVRAAAAQLLRGRPFEHYVPNLLAVMRTPIEVRQELSVDARGRLIHQQVFVRENQEQADMLVRGTEYRRQYVGGGNRQFAAWQAGLDMAEQNTESGRRVALENMTTLERNERIALALASGTEQALGTDPKEWWNWWNKYNDMQVAGEKPVNVRVALRSVNVIDGVPESSGTNSADSGSGSPPPLNRVRPTGGIRRVGECLVAGTPVRTHRGMVPIEQMRVGDLVLSQHPDTGELTYKPVLKTTVTPAGPLMRVEVGDRETFRCTNGHLFWVSGEGWRQARELRSGNQLHTPQGTVTVSHVEPAPAEQTYNLIVADFHTYFAGQRGVLSHDNTLRQPTQAIVPGLAVK